MNILEDFIDELHGDGRAEVHEIPGVIPDTQIMMQGKHKHIRWSGVSPASHECAGAPTSYTRK